MKERAVLYARISYDRTGDEVGVQRQLHDMRELANTRGYEVVAEVAENDISASKGLRRPGYEQVWQMVTDEQVDHVVVWHTSRLVRGRGDRAAVINTFGNHGVGIVAVKGPSLDLRSAYGRGIADLMTAFDSMEGEVKAERVSAAITDLARRGKSWGICPYGWDRIGKGINADQVENTHEADIVRELVDRLLAGESLNELQRDMNDRDEPSPGFCQWMKLPEATREQRLAKGRKSPSRAWAKSTVRTLVQRDVNVGVRSRSGGVDLAGDWPAIVDRAKHDRVLALLKSPERRLHSGPRPGARKHLITNGIGKCGVCGDVLRVARRNGRRDQVLIYTCNGPKGCTGRMQEPVDRLVGKFVVARMAQPDALDWLMGDDDEARRLAQKCDELQRQLDDAADSYADGKLNVRILERITARLAPELEEAQRQRDAAVRSVDISALRPLAGPEAAARWEAMSVAAQRAVLEALGCEVVILPRAKHGPGFEPESIRIEWRK
ncbi:recombinase family protein [Mycolicibacterium septicum]|uniref:Recombinase family protein n=1 Tax=Mycolicibacterium septicum TaxID=98668 RepID=A0ABW9LUN6_9MYCO